MPSGQKELFFLNSDFASKEDAVLALIESEARFQSIANNSAGIIVQFQLNASDEIQFNYLGDKCKDLLGFNPHVLKKDASKLLANIHERDHITLKNKVNNSLHKRNLLNWEGRVWLETQQETKWINLRATPRLLHRGTVVWDGIIHDITKQKIEKNSITQSKRSLAKLSAHMNQIKEHERSRIAREIHDDVGGNLTAIKIGLSAMINRLNNGKKVLIEEAKNLEMIVDNTFDAIHRISTDLRPNVLDLGITAALDWQVRSFEKQLGIKCRLHCNNLEVPTTTDQAVTLFRICQEAMSNIAKHAKATTVDVQLIVDMDEIIMRIKDNGVGIKPSDTLKANSFGLRGMQERVEALNGRFDITELNTPGTIIEIILPIQRENDFF